MGSQHRRIVHQRGKRSRNCLQDAREPSIKNVVRLQYPITNNEAEYEALLTGLHVAKALGATTLKV